MDASENPYASPLAGLTRDEPAPPTVDNPLAHPAVLAGAKRVRKWILPYVILVSIITAFSVLGLLGFIIVLATVDVSPVWLAAAGVALVIGTGLTLGVLITVSGYRGQLAHFLHSRTPEDLTDAVRRANTCWKINIALAVFYAAATFLLTQWLSMVDPTWQLRLNRRFGPGAAGNRPMAAPRNPGRFR